jgi:hypothetical protein
LPLPKGGTCTYRAARWSSCGYYPWLMENLNTGSGAGLGGWIVWCGKVRSGWPRREIRTRASPRAFNQATPVGLPLEWRDDGAALKRGGGGGCPSDLDPLMRKAGGMWEPGGRRWLIMRRRVGPLIRNLRLVTDPLFRHAELSLEAPS